MHFIINHFITKINFKGIQVNVPVADLMIEEMSGERNTIVFDNKGVPYVTTYVNADVVTMILDVEYKYENINFEAIDANTNTVTYYLNGAKHVVHLRTA